MERENYNKRARRRGCRDRGSKGVEWEMSSENVFPFPADYGVYASVVSSLHMVWSGALAEIEIRVF